MSRRVASDPDSGDQRRQDGWTTIGTSLFVRGAQRRLEPRASPRWSNRLSPTTSMQDTDVQEGHPRSTPCAEARQQVLGGWLGSIAR
jgi:hypothetical protein